MGETRNTPFVSSPGDWNHWHQVQIIWGEATIICFDERPSWGRKDFVVTYSNYINNKQIVYYTICYCYVKIAHCLLSSHQVPNTMPDFTWIILLNSHT